VITLDTARTTARQTLATVAERAEQHGYYAGAHTAIINSHADLRAALDMLVKAAEHAAADTRPGARAG
jgi:DNA-binding ferritin-like protein